MSETSPVPSPQRPKPTKTREEPPSVGTASRIPVKQRPAQPPLHVRSSQTRVQPSESSGSISRRGRSFSINPSSTVSSYKPPTQTAKRALSSELTQQPTPTPSPTQSLNAVRTQPPAPSPPLSRPSQGTGPQPPIHFSRTPQGGSLSLAPSTHIPRAVQTSLYKRAQSVGTTSYAVAETARLRLIERATKARLYLLHQIGPNRFLIGGDSLDSRFHVTIGSQTCTCGKQHCIHLLFVMLRVLKVSPGDHLLWAKQLRNYEAEGLLQDLHTRNTQRNTPKKINKRRFDFTTQKMHTEGSGRLRGKTGSDDRDDGDETLRDDSHNIMTEFGEGKEREEGDGECLGDRECVGGGGEEGEREESDKSEEEDVCPICLNELDEGEDLITCRCCGNRLHQHCMDIWAGEQIRKKEVVQCPVCRTSWHHSSPSPSKRGSQSFLQVSVPVGAEGGRGAMGGGGGGLRLKSLSPSQEMHLSEEKVIILEKIRKAFGGVVMDGVLSPDWKSREMAITHTSREVISLLLPQMKVTTPSTTVARTNWREVQEAAFVVILNGCSESVLKVFLASLELLRVVLGYTVCSTMEDSVFLQTLLNPLVLTLLTRCADAQSRVKECSVDTMCHFCLGQEGPLSLGSACGQTSPYCVSSLPFIMRCALKREDTPHETGVTQQSWHWWLGRLNFFDRIIQRFSWDFLLSNCIQRPPFAPPSPPDLEDSLNSVSLRSMDAAPSSLELPSEDEMDRDNSERSDSHRSDTLSAASSTEGGGPSGNYLLPPPPLFPSRNPHATPSPHPAAETNLLAQAWYFAAQATHVPHNKVGKVARRVIIRIAKVLRNEAFSQEIIHDVVSRCHRTQAEGLLERALAACEKPATPSHHGGQCDGQREEKRVEKQEVEREGGEGKASPQLSYSPFPEIRKKKVNTKTTPSTNEKSASRRDSPGGVDSSDKRRMSEYGSDDSYRSAVSDLSGEDRGDSEGGRGGDRGEDQRGASGASSDSKSDDKSGGSAEAIKLPAYYRRQMTADSAFSSGSVSTEPDTSLTGREVFMCKRNIEEEEAAAEAKVRSMLPDDMPHPSLFGIRPPNPEVLIHIQTSGTTEATDGGSTYMEGRHWVKGKLIGTGAFCSCFLARDTRLGTMMAVKQVSYARNTKTEEEEELKRLQEEVMMLGRLSHPNIVRCLGATQHEGHINIFIEWMAGGCLDQVLHDFGPFTENVICNYTRQIIYGIVYLHENGVIHRDLKGGNVLLDSTGQRIRIADFGAAARLASHTTGLGEFQDMEGTVAFMAPEVVRGGTSEEGSATGYGRKCDVWSIGCVIIQMASAKAPWAGTYDVKNKFQLIFKIGQATEPPPMPPFSNPALKDLTLRCLEVNPDERPVSSELLKHPLFTSS